MSLIINAPNSKVATYDVANQTDIQLNFEFDPSQFQVDGTTLVIDYEGSAIRLENFFGADGSSHVDNFMTQDGQEFSAPEFLSAILESEGGGDTAEDLETAAGADGGGSGAGEYSDDPGSLFDGLNALGDQPDAYAQPTIEPLEEVPGATTQGGGDINYQPGDIWWWMETEDGTYVEVRRYEGSEESDPTQDWAVLVGQNRTYETYIGGPGIDTLYLTDDANLTAEKTPGGYVPLTANGDALLLEDDLSFPENPGQPRIQDIEIIRAGEGNDVVDMSSDTFEYGDVTIYGGGGDDILWGNVGDDTIYGEEGDDKLVGGLGDDVLVGGVGEDLLKGLEGNDILNGGEGSDNIFGGSGNDVVNAGIGEHDKVTLGTGEDTLVISGDSLTAGADSDPFGAGSTVEVLDFGKQDSLDLGSFSIFETRTSDVTGDGKDDLQLYVGDDPSGNTTWIVLNDTSLGDLSTEVQQYIIDHMYTTSTLT